MHHFPTRLSCEMEEEVEEENQGESGRLGGGVRLLLEVQSASWWELGPLPVLGPSYSFLPSQLLPFSPTQEAQPSKEMGRGWGYPLLGAEELAPKFPKMGPR